MNQIRAIEKRNEQELKQNLTNASWHDKYKESAYIYIGGLDLELSEGDIITAFSQYGEIVDIDLKRDEKGVSKGFCFLAYEDQRSTNLAVDNFNGIKLGDRNITVDHKLGYFKKMDSETQAPKSLIDIEKENQEFEKLKLKQEKKKLKEEKRKLKEEKKKKKEEKRKREELESIEPKVVGPQKPVSKTVEEAPILEDPKEVERRNKVYNKEFWFDQNINVDPKKLSERSHYEQSYLYGLRKDEAPDTRFTYDHLKYYDSITHKDTEHKIKKQKHKDKIEKKINKY